MSPAESREPGMRWYGGLGADHGQKRELGGVTITRGDLTSPGLHCRATIRILAALRRLIQSFGLAGQPRLALPPGVIEPVCPEPGIVPRDCGTRPKGIH